MAHLLSPASAFVSCGSDEAVDVPFSAMHLGIKANIPLQIISQINHILFQNILLFQQCLQCQN